MKPYLSAPVMKIILLWILLQTSMQVRKNIFLLEAVTFLPQNLCRNEDQITTQSQMVLQFDIEPNKDLSGYLVLQLNITQSNVLILSSPCKLNK